MGLFHRRKKEDKTAAAPEPKRLLRKARRSARITQSPNAENASPHELSVEESGVSEDGQGPEGPGNVQGENIRRHTRDERGRTEPSSYGDSPLNYLQTDDYTHDCNRPNDNNVHSRLYNGEYPREHNHSYTANVNSSSIDTNDDSYDSTPGLSRSVSPALSDTETLAYTKTQRLQLQETYAENFSVYLPYLLRRLRVENRRRSPSPSSDTTVASIQPAIMGRSVDEYTHKRTMVVASELLGKILVFASAEDFEAFKISQKNKERGDKGEKKKEKAKSDKSKRRSSDGQPKNSIPESRQQRNSMSENRQQRNSIHESRQRHNSIHENGQRHNSIHERHARNSTSGTHQNGHLNSNHHSGVSAEDGQAANPILRVSVPYMSVFRRKVPYMIFECLSEGELVPFCAVHMRTHAHFRRYLMHFTPPNGTPFTVAVFQNNFRPFSDFEYNHTRFRVVGTSVAAHYLSPYNPELKLLVVDATQPALCDNLVPRARRPSRRGSAASTSSSERMPSSEMEDPVPEASNRILLEDSGGFSRPVRNYIPNELPPFGLFMDACAEPGSRSLLPRKFADAGKVVLYEPPEQESSLDSLVLTSVMLTLRETALRTTTRYPNSVLLGPMAALYQSQTPGITASM
ncbi:hypothetical protein EJF18_10614 [Clavispora lusitaniae]|uniref:Uncharacterized protein n=1 Tax=Clavispora lusitaniae TaxID=36911 RepID=A0ACD0WDA7_CLALS|nr:hypothetical protein EJF14_10614 [Clavispora lusitaniae]QFZ31179.1 hypothetical protein EJF16_10614 [Clavispora lusitaniae]QFZ36847.1 hypothetical protein EJF15_10614 [Clavispora lusitaniae]QFZ42531.1 hypothetical protein EJF18_10614 [Clavispora lusitaniae]QFZ48207.1 hypothetical protein EJF17_10614 [Clavispora lusitaniae]